MNFVLSRYQNETGKTMKLSYQREDQQAFSTWKNKIFLPSQLLFKTLVKEYLEEQEYLFELASSKEESISNLFPKQPNFVEVVPYCDLKKDLKSTFFFEREEQMSGCFVMQGVYTEHLEYLNRFLDQGSFAIGIVGEKQSEGYKLEKKYYRQVYDTLLKKGVSLNEPIQETKGNLGAYILTKKVVR